MPAAKRPYRSKFEERVAAELKRKRIKFEYETYEISYLHSVTGGECLACGSNKCGQKRIYIPDFYLPKWDLFIEAKGKFTGPMRTKHLAIAKTDPELDVRFLFQRNNWITKAHKSKYGDWCDKKAFHWSVFPKLPLYGCGIGVI